MITGEQQSYTFNKIYSLMKTPRNHFGETFVKYLEPIRLEKFVADDLKLAPLDDTNFETATLKLTEHLLRTQ